MLRSLARPREFAGALANEHFGLAGVLVALVAGLAVSLGVDLVVLASKGLSPLPFAGRLVIDALFLAVRLLVVLAAVATAAHLAMRALRQRQLTLDQTFTALAFAMGPLLLAPLPGLLILAAPATLPLAGALAAIIVLRVFVGLGLDLAALLPLPLALVAFFIVVVLTGLAMPDQVSRVRFATYAAAPALVPPLEVAAATGQRFDGDGFALTLPTEWHNETKGIPGEAARFETPAAVLVVARVRGNPFATPDGYADTVAVDYRTGLRDERRSRSVVRANDLVLVDDLTTGVYQGESILVHQFTTVSGTQALALVFRYFHPQDAGAAVAASTAIAATWRVAAR